MDALLRLPPDELLRTLKTGPLKGTLMASKAIPRMFDRMRRRAKAGV